MAMYASASDEENYERLINSPPLVVEPLPHDHPLAVEPFPLVLGMFDMAEARALFGERAEDDNRNNLAYVLRYLRFFARVIFRILFNFDAMDEENDNRLRSLAVIDPLAEAAAENDDGLAAESNDALAEAAVLLNEPADDDSNSLALIQLVGGGLEADEEGFGSEDEEGWDEFAL